VNLLTDTLPALALATDRNPGAMARTPRPASAPLLDRVSLLFVLIVGILGGLVGLGLYWQLPRSGYAAGSTQTIVFCFLVFVQLSFVLPARRVHWQPLFNIWVPLAISASVAAQFAVLALPALSAALQVVSLRRGDLGVIAVATAGCWLLAEATSAYSRSRGTLAAPEINPR
jgi:Ca2+-transporting ATPase